MLAITDELGRFEEFFSDVIYPVWPIWLLDGFIGLGLLSYVAYRLGFHVWVVQHGALTGAAIAVALIFTVPIGYYTISPLFKRETVCEASPISGAGAGSADCKRIAQASTVAPTTADTSTDDDTVGVAGPQIITRGEFQGADDFHFGEGQALLIETEPGEYTLRLENFSVRNGPDLFVLLSTDANGYGEGSLNLGSLKGTDGAFNYEVPADTDLSQFKSAIVWCDQFSVLFATAPFM